jgi:hypothetical protein
VSRHGVDHTKRFAGIAAAITKLSAGRLVLDGEIPIYDQQGRSRFDWPREPDPAAVATPPLYMAFDVLHRDGRDLTARPSLTPPRPPGGRRRRQRAGVPGAAAGTGRAGGVEASDRALA